jgi:hypothetical protein
MTVLRIIEGGWIELDNIRVARLKPELTPTLIDQLSEAFEELDERDENADRVVWLEGRLEDLEADIERLRAHLTKAAEGAKP